IGFVTRVVPVDELDAAVDDLAATLASKSPLILRWGRESFYRTLDMDPDDALAYLQAMLTITSASEDTADGVAAFAEKRAPGWTYPRFVTRRAASSPSRTRSSVTATSTWSSCRGSSPTQISRGRRRCPPSSSVASGRSRG